MLRPRFEHLPEYSCDFLGTALMMALGVGAIALMWSEGSPMAALIPSEGLRRLMTGVLFAGGATAVVLSPIGQRSGGHLNPAVTLAFWWQGRITGSDATAYIVAQVLGAILGVAIVAAAAFPAAKSVQLGLTAPGTGFSLPVVFLAELGATFLLLMVILMSLHHQRFAPRTPFFAGTLVALLVFI